MGPVPATPAQSKSRKAPATASKTAGTVTRTTRKRAGTKNEDENDVEDPRPTLHTKPSISLFAKGLREASDKMLHRDKESKHIFAGNRSRATSSGSDNHYSESLKAFLRIRPPPESSSTHSPVMPYLEAENETQVIMRPPMDPSRPHASKSPNIYSFDKVFPPASLQDEFFSYTTLPLVKKLLHGENGLMFAYGVSNSGKSYTIAGTEGTEGKDRGLLPRSIDVIFNSIGSNQSSLPLRCVGVADVEMAAEEHAFARAFDQLRGETEACTPQTITIDKNYGYAVFVSYAEVYNEKIFDLLDAVLPNSSSQLTSTKSSSSNARSSSAWALSSSLSLAALANGGGGVLKRRALALKNDPDGNGKYVAGLNEVRVRTRDEALSIFRAGQRARQVFGTLANRESSRSHGIFSIKIVRIHNGAPKDIDGVQVSKLSIVDLAGSERTRNTGTTGDRLKEAGNINKSLMVLGQCLEVLRSNQQKMSLATGSNQKKKLAVVPFRHSKLTEIFQNSFVGDGSAVMIVNVNPYDTGYDENAHVMRFSAVAQEVQTIPTSKSHHGFSGGTLRRQISTQFSALKQAVSGGGQGKIKVMVPVVPKISAPTSASSSMTSLPEPEIEMVEEELEIVEEDADEASDEEGDILVDYLFDQIRELKTMLYESEMRNASIEAEVREELSEEMQKTIDAVQKQSERRLHEQVLASERKMDMKIDIVSRSMSKPAQPRYVRTKVSPSKDTTYLRATPEIDADSSFESQTINTTFESAVEGSLFTDEDADEEVLEGDGVDDPFVVRKTGKSEIESESDDEEDIDESESEDHAEAGDGQDDDDELTEEESEGEDSDGEAEEEDDEEEEEDVSESEEETESDYSAFESNVSSSVSPSPVRRSSIKPRHTSTTTPSRPRNSMKTPARLKTPVHVPSPKSVPESTASGTMKIQKTPLGENLEQDKVAVASDDDDEIADVTATVKRKRRTLGKKVLLEDDIQVDSHKLGGGADIRRLGSRAALY
ncbi:P-loop containing nucleoside triphosphate hydrolase protein [Kockovaella imperatae]|uniref:Kinesin-like protein n=1 Tax=Kockovaella imperatae TaxID=4999 RepID=A0A1Y1UMH8_9TREE|nr:P-loop containing nucleoside triphosphate hydrolase protein [Kockovaella imperatae]ORX38676.1 P-loop containing nucleoside triphosphate hydrolase protein [Kockovaella imperatae]